MLEFQIKTINPHWMYRFPPKIEDIPCALQIFYLDIECIGSMEEQTTKGKGRMERSMKCLSF